MSGHGSLVLGVETSCDDTAVALVDKGGSVIASCVASQAALHTTFGGVYPELASRAHIDKILPTVQAVLSDSGVRPADLAAIGVTRGPGLIGSLMVGLNTAAGLGHGLDWQLLLGWSLQHLFLGRSEEGTDRRIDDGSWN